MLGHQCSLQTVHCCGCGHCGTIQQASWWQLNDGQTLLLLVVPAQQQ
jgi:hypothetical protein